MNALDVLYAVSFVFLVMFLGYVALIVIPFLRHRTAPEGDAEEFGWHVFVPCRDEAAVIGSTLITLRIRFPDAHVWVVDDDSDDDTVIEVTRVAEDDPHIHLVRRCRPDARTGKGDALNSAYRAMREQLPGDVDPDKVVVIVVDADGDLAENALRQASGPRAFGDPRTGAAQAAVRMSNRNQRPSGGDGARRSLLGRYLVRMQDIEFRTTIAAMQSLRTHTLSVGLGGNGQFTRLSALDAAAVSSGEPWGNALLEDYELGLRVILAGYLTVYMHDTHVDQEGLPSLRRLLTQRTRWCQGGMQCARYLPRIYASGSFSNAGAVEAAYFLLQPYLQLAGVFLWPTVLISMIVQGWMTKGDVLTWAAQASWLIPLCIVTGIVPFMLWPFIYGHRDEPAPLALSLMRGIGYWLYMYLAYVCVLRAFARLLSGRNGWAKTRRNTETGRQLLAKES